MTERAAVSGSADDMLGRLEEQSGRPLRAMLEISDRCNEVCVHCYQVQGRKGEMTTEQLKGVLDELAELGVLILTFSGGECTLRSDFLELIGYARQLGFLLRIYTNGLTMTAALAQALRKHAVLDVEISLYSPRADVHDFVTGVPGSFDKTVNGIRHLTAAGVAVTVKSVVMSVNQADLDEYASFVTALGAQVSFDASPLVSREFGDRSPEMLNADPAALAGVHRKYNQLAVAAAEPAAFIDPHRSPFQPVCGAAATVHVEPNGELRPCTVLEVKLGDALQGSGVRAAYDSETAKDMRALVWNDLHGCRDCELSSRCLRCHSASLVETGDALGPYPTACRSARALYEQSSPRGLRVVAANSRQYEAVDSPSALGPYREITPGLLEAFDDIVTPADDALAARLGWVRRAGGGIRAPELAVRPGELIQIRRPGRKTSRLERVPGDSKDNSLERGSRTTARDPAVGSAHTARHDSR